MRHVQLTCLNHTNLRWSCKSVAVNQLGQYNGARNIFFSGAFTGVPYSDGSGWECDNVVDGKVVEECKCPPTDLRFSPEELEKQKTQPIDWSEW